jgi:hypothetical protein
MPKPKKSNNISLLKSKKNLEITKQRVIYFILVKEYQTNVGRIRPQKE